MIADHVPNNVASWKAEDLFHVPKMELINVAPLPGIRSFFYEGIEWKGRPTKVLAYFGEPEGPPPPGGWPAVVCVHGGGGSVHPEWIRAWNAHGYAAISMDLEGHLADAVTTFDGSGPVRDWPGPAEQAAHRFYRTDEPIQDLWFYQAIAQVARAHSLLRTFPEINRDKIGLAGLSWGGILASTTVGLDSRYKFAVIFYGCGFLSESDSYMHTLFSIDGDRKARIPFEPSLYLPQASLPIFWVNGTNDHHFPPNIWQKSALSTQGPHAMRLTIRMPHGPDTSWTTPEVFAFADDALAHTSQLPKLAAPEIKDGNATVALLNDIHLKSVALEYTVDKGTYELRNWRTASGAIDDKHLISATLPKGTTGWAFLVTDDKNNQLSSDYVDMGAHSVNDFH